MVDVRGGDASNGSITDYLRSMSNRAVGKNDKSCKRNKGDLSGTEETAGVAFRSESLPILPMSNARICSPSLNTWKAGLVEHWPLERGQKKDVPEGVPSRPCQRRCRPWGIDKNAESATGIGIKSGKKQNMFDNIGKEDRVSLLERAAF